MNRQLRKSLLIILSVTALFICVMIAATHFNSKYNKQSLPQKYSENSNMAYIYTQEMGCIPTTLTKQQFDNQQKMYQEIFGTHYIRCK